MFKSVGDMRKLFKLWGDLQDKLIDTLGHMERTIDRGYGFNYSCNKKSSNRVTYHK